MRLISDSYPLDTVELGALVAFVADSLGWRIEGVPASSVLTLSTSPLGDADDTTPLTVRAVSNTGGSQLEVEFSQGNETPAGVLLDEVRAACQRESRLRAATPPVC